MTKHPSQEENCIVCVDGDDVVASMKAEEQEDSMAMNVVEDGKCTTLGIEETGKYDMKARGPEIPHTKRKLLEWSIFDYDEAEKEKEKEVKERPRREKLEFDKHTRLTYCTSSERLTKRELVLRDRHLYNKHSEVGSYMYPFIKLRYGQRTRPDSCGTPCFAKLRRMTDTSHEEADV